MKRSTPALTLRYCLGKCWHISSFVQYREPEFQRADSTEGHCSTQHPSCDLERITADAIATTCTVCGAGTFPALHTLPDLTKSALSHPGRAIAVGRFIPRETLVGRKTAREELCDGWKPKIRHHSVFSPTISPVESTSRAQAAGCLGRPGIRLIPSVITKRNPAPALRRASWMGTRKPAGRPSNFGS